jgi:hypothetical protein
VAPTLSVSVDGNSEAEKQPCLMQLLLKEIGLKQIMSNSNLHKLTRAELADIYEKLVLYYEQHQG